MSGAKKLKLGPLPEQQDNYKEFEQTEILWGRVFVVILVLGIAAVGIASFFSSYSDQSDGNSLGIELDGNPPMVKSLIETKEPSSKLTDKAESTEANNQSRASAASESITPVIALEKQPKSEVASGESSDLKSPETASKAYSEVEKTSVLADRVPEKPALAKVISPVSMLHEGLIRAELANNVVDGKPVEPLGYQVPMTEEGIIKVVLYTEMSQLKGRVLYHEWYRNEQRMARVKIPVNITEQASYSSKFINRQMLGDWRVKIVDASGELYGEANFLVR